MIFPEMTKPQPPRSAGVAPRRARLRSRARRNARSARPRNRASSERPSSGRATSATACCGCCRRIPSPSTGRASPAASSPISRPQGRLSLFDQSGERSAADLLHRLCRQGRRPEPSRHLRLQRRPRRSIGISQSRPGRSADRRIRRQRSGGDAAARQSADLAGVHRSGHDRPDRNRLEPPCQARWRQRLLWRAERRAGARQDHRALSRQEWPRPLAQISSRRELRRIPCRQGGAGAQTRAGYYALPASSWCRR